MIFNFFTLLAQDFGHIDPPTEAHNPTAAQMNNPNTVLYKLEGIISTIIGVITIVAVLFFIIKFFTGAFSMITAGEDKGKFTSGLEKIKHAILGLILIVASYSLIALLGTVIGIQMLDVGDLIRSVAPGGGGPLPIPVPPGPGPIP